MPNCVFQQRTFFKIFFLNTVQTSGQGAIVTIANQLLQQCSDCCHVLQDATLRLLATLTDQLIRFNHDSICSAHTQLLYFHLALIVVQSNQPYSSECCGWFMIPMYYHVKLVSFYVTHQTCPLWHSVWKRTVQWFPAIASRGRRNRSNK